MKDLTIRTITGLIFVAVIVGCILYSPVSYVIVFLILCGLTTWEFCTLINKHLNCQINKFITTTASAYLFVAITAFNMNVTGAEIFIPYLITLVYLLISELYFKNNNVLMNWAFSMMSQLYIGLPFALLSTLSFIGVNKGYGENFVIYNPVFTMSVFAFIWLGDTSAYIFGTKFGKHRLFKCISPKKSWEGTIAALITAVIISQVIATFCNDFNPNNDLINRIAWAGLGLLVVGFGTWGDLVESLIKRKIGVKDSGAILPGHGGFLDRFDSSLIAIPIAVIYIYTLNQFM